ncbi:low temperature requirement protein A [Raineyella sp.]|uniref:low temperature requirement protein A n=1 Tax=Raineyella sp. TaxID=1911550 RepID=UPI002B208D2B|nr:low temperature requirement protein A [Raineyella sp.]MEA5154243.1 low temperature requirement protein A [Raineyella sp.]
MTTPAEDSPGRHRLSPLAPRDTEERHRVASPLELLFDLTFAVAFGLSGEQFAHYLAEGHLTTALIGFGFAGFGIVWAWINYSWFASAYDNDDWGLRLMSMAIMVGVVVLALGIPPMYHSLESPHFDNRTIILGYVVMRLALLVGWARAWRADVPRRGAIGLYLGSIIAAQAAWVAVALLPLTVTQTLGIAVVLVLVEVLGPFLAERRAGTPWHAHHIAERYSLLVIITLGEGVIGTVAALTATIGEGHWTLAGVLVVVAGIGLTFGLWWVYFTTTVAEVLHHYRGRSFLFGYLHMPLFWAVAATGSGLHVAGLWIAGESDLALPGVVATVAVPVLAYICLVYAIYSVMHRGGAGGHVAFHVSVFALTVAIIAASVGLAYGGVPLGWCLVVVMLGPLVTVVAYEARGYRHIRADRTVLLERAARREG